MTNRYISYRIRLKLLSPPIYQPIECPAGETIHYGGGAINRYECAAGDTQCPGGGGYSLGCRIPFTQATDNTGGDDDDDDAASSVAAVSALMVAAVSFALRV